MTFSVTVLSDRAWKDAAAEFCEYGYRQTAAFSRLTAARMSAVAEAVVCTHKGGVVGAAIVRVRRLPVVGGGIAYISGGPLVRRVGAGADESGVAFRATMESLVRAYVDERGFVLRVSPPLGDEAWDIHVAAVLQELGFGLTRRARYRTLLVNLSPGLPQLRSALQQKWRNCLNNGERQGLELLESVEPDAMDEFAELYRDFVDRKRFRAELGAEFYAAVQREALQGERLLVQVARREGRLLAGHVSSIGGDTCVYLLGATSEEGLKCKAAYLLQWRTIQRAKERAQCWYDLGGIDPDGNPGVHHFKAGLGGAERFGAGEFELRPRSMRAFLASSSEGLYRRAKRVRARMAERR